MMAVWMFMLSQFAFALSADFFQGQAQVLKIRLKIYDIFSSNLLDQDAIDSIDWQSQNMLSLLLLYTYMCTCPHFQSSVSSVITTGGLHRTTLSSKV